MKNQKKFALFLCIGMLASMTASCGGTSEAKDTTADEVTSDVATTEAGYDYPDVDYGGYTFRVLNFDRYVNCAIRVDVTEQTGEKLDDAIYMRNRKVEEKLNFRMKEIQHAYGAWSATQKELISLVTTSVMAGDDEYDAAYLNINFNTGAIADGALVDLKTISTLNLDEAWWDHKINDSLEMNGHLFCASSPMMLESFDMTWCLLFNENMMTDYGLEYPYQLVRDGKWTLDKLYEYCAKAANLNGDESFASYVQDGEAVYGIAGHLSSAEAFVYSAGNNYIKSENGKYSLNIDNEHFYNSVEKIQKVLNLDSGYVRFNNGGKGTQGGYIDMFATGRAMFMTAELKSAMEERDMEDDFGLLPFPKYDETQKDYVSLVNGGSAVLCVPATAKDLDRTGVILDSLSYESNISVLPVYYDVTVSQKGLRNEDSIDMLKILRENRGCDMGQFLSLTSSITSAIQSLLTTGGTNEPASIVAANKSAVEATIQSTLEAIG